MKRILIIGGGISGLAAAHRLTELNREDKHHLEIILVEANDRLGGTIRTEHREGFLLEHGPDSFISEKPEAVKLARTLGIDSRLIHTNDRYRRSFIVRKGRLRRVPEGFQLLAPSRLWPFVTSDIFSVAGKLRMAADLFLPRARLNGSGDESLASFVTRRFGKEALERMAQPMVGGIYTADPRKLSLRATLPRFLEMERDHRSIILALMRTQRGSVSTDESAGVSGARYGLFLSFDKGMQVLTDELQRHLLNAGVRLELSTKIAFLDHQQNNGSAQWIGTTSAGKRLNVDVVCLAIPAYTAASLVEPFDRYLGQNLKSINYASTAIVNLAYKRQDIEHPLDGFGFVVPFVEKRSLIACSFSSVKFQGRASAKHVLLRAFVGGALQPEMFDLDEEDMVRHVRTDLSDLLGIRGQPIFVETAKWYRSMPQYEVGHLERIGGIEQQLDRLPTLALAGNSYKGAGIPDCVRSGTAAAERIFASLGQMSDKL